MPSGMYDHKKLSIEERLLRRRSITSGGCWEWTGFRDPNGYGRIKTYAPARLCHRVAYMEFVGEIPDGLFVCHKCDNPACFNPDHLFLGDNFANVRDAVSKGRHSVGESHYNTSLTEDMVREIRQRRARGERCKDLAKEYGVNSSTITHIAKRQTWKHLP